MRGNVPRPWIVVGALTAADEPHERSRDTEAHAADFESRRAAQTVWERPVVHPGACVDTPCDLKGEVLRTP
jgi:hypothetical protein